MSKPMNKPINEKKRRNTRSRQIRLIAVLLVVLLAASGFAIHTVRSRNAVNTAQNNTQLASGDASADGTADKTADGTAPPELLSTLFFASDYQAEQGWDDPADSLAGILEAVDEDGHSVDMAVMCGDYTNDRNLHDYQLSPDESIARIRQVFEDEYDLADEDILIEQGNHDRMTSQITESGLHEYDDYLIYVLNTQNDFPWKQGKTSGCLNKVKASSEAMKECFDELINRGETRPVFIAGHVPLHFTARTSSHHTTGDNLYSSLIFDAVNEAAKSLDIVYLFGHNHSKGWDCYMGGSSVYKAPGDNILIPEFDSSRVTTDEYSTETLNFTYMNAGYVGYYMNCGPDELESGQLEQYRAADETLTGTVFEIYSDHIAITRYDENGVHVLGHAGEGNPYKGHIDNGLIPETAYSTETPSPQEIKRHSF